MMSQVLPATEFKFTLPKGLVDDQGQIHREGAMRLATARDEIVALRDSRTQDDDIYGVLVILAQVITRLGTLPAVTPEQLENLFSLDLAYLREFYNRINQQGDPYIPVDCPHCKEHFQVELALSGEF